MDRSQIVEYQTALPQNERDELSQQEDVIERGLNTFVDVGNALLAIRDKRLYREGYGTFEEYCRERWGFTRMRASQLITATLAVQNVNHGLQIPAPTSERQARPLTRLAPQQQREAWAEAVETAPNGKVTAAHVQRTVDRIAPPPRPHITLINDNNEWYTPREYIKSAIAVMGGIDTDPASNEMAQEWIKATTYYTKDTNGLSHDWHGRVWLNPPWGNDTPRFIEKLFAELSLGNVIEAIVLVNAHATDTQWFTPLWDGLLCFTNHRINYESPYPASGGSTHGSVFVYFGDNESVFIECFRQWGPIVKRVRAL